jgi:pentatricopeptide repeat protein
LLSDAQGVFDLICTADVTAWNVLIGGYNKHGHGYGALDCFERMKLECISPNVVTLLCALQACCSIGSIGRGHRIHIEILEKNADSELLIGSTLVDMYAKCGFLKDAEAIFDKMPIRSTISWNTLTSGYSKQGLHDEEAFRCFFQMQLECILPDLITFLHVLNACANIGDASMGRLLHAVIVSNGFLDRDSVGNALIDMYVKCGLFECAGNVFDELVVHDTISWNAFLAGYTNQGFLGCEDAMLTFIDLMEWEGVSPDTFTYVCCLRACANHGAVHKGRALHMEVSRKGFGEDRHVCNALIDMYTKFRLLYESHDLFERLPHRNVVSWTALIGGYTELGFGEKALKLFDEMQMEGICPNNVTFVCGLKACSDVDALGKGQAIHAEISRKGLLGKDVVLGSMLVDMYARCDMLAKAEEILSVLPTGDVIAWNAIISGCIQQCHCEEALIYFKKMQLKGVSPNSVTYVCCLKAACLVSGRAEGLEIYADISRNGLFERDPLVRNALISMCGECGCLAQAQAVFDKLIRDRDIVSWTSLLCAYAKHGYGEEALACLKEMQFDGFSPNCATFLSSVKACCAIGASHEGFRVHSQIMKSGFEKDLQIGSMLVTMYAACGMHVAEAQKVFDDLSSRDVVAWNALIVSYVRTGDEEGISRTLERMKNDGKDPDLVTLINTLNACSRGGLVEKGKMYYDTMRTQHGIDPLPQLQGCMIDLFGRTGHLEEAVGMHLEPNLVLSNIILSACRSSGNVDLGKHTLAYAAHFDA